MSSLGSQTLRATHTHAQTHRYYLLALFAYLWMCSSCSSYVLIALFGWYFKYLTLISNVRIVIVAWGMWHVAMEGLFIHPLGACVCNNFAVQLVLCTKSSGKWLSRGIFLPFFFYVVALLFSLCTLLVVFMATINIKVFPCAHTHTHAYSHAIRNKVGTSDLAGWATAWVCVCVCLA